MALKADYVCQPCLDAERLAEPIELPVMSKVCPVCAEATLERVWTPPMVIARGLAEEIRMSPEAVRRTDALMRPQFEQQERERPRHDYSVRAVSTQNVGAEMAKISGGQVAMALPTSGAPAKPIGSAQSGVSGPHARTIVAGKWTPPA